MDEVSFPFASVKDLNHVFSDEKLPFDRYSSLEALKYETTVNSDRDELDAELFRYNFQSCSYSDIDNFYSILRDQEFSLLFLNINSLSKHYDSIFSDFLCGAQSPKIMGFCETKISPELESLYRLPGYTSIFNSKNTQSGGLAIFLKDYTNYEVLSDYSFMCDSFESLCIKLEMYKETFYLCLLYRRPNSTQNEFINFHEKITIDLKDEKCIFFGDLNIDLLTYETSNFTETFVNLNFQFNFFPLINKPTRVSSHSATVIDQFWCNFIHQKTFENIILQSDISDHFSVLTKFKSIISTNLTRSIKCRDWEKFEDGSFHDQLETNLAEFNLNLGSETSDIDDSLNKLVSIISKVFNENCPVKVLHFRREKNPWMNTEIKRFIKERNKLCSKYFKKPITYGPEYRQCRNKVNNLIKSAKKLYYRNKFLSVQNNSKKTWKILNELLGRGGEKECLNKIMDNNNVTTDEKKIANIMNDHFTNVPLKIASSLSNPSNLDYRYYLRGNYFHSFFLQPLNVHQIIKITLEFNNTPSEGYLGIPSKIVKSIIDLIAEPLMLIFNKCIEIGYFPDILKIGQITPVFKSGDPLQPNNFRPISVLTIFSKIFEKHIYNELLMYFEQNNILCKEQFGFRKGISTNIAIANLLEKIYGGLERNIYGIGVFLDLQKAFDVVNRRILLGKLNHYGVRGAPLQLLSSFLTNRKQYVKIKNNQSDTSLVQIGTPQGSILSPLLFLIFINDIVNCSNVLHFNLFADDTCVYLNDANLKELYRNLNLELVNLGKWISANCLSLNLSKTVYLLFSGKKTT